MVLASAMQHLKALIENLVSKTGPKLL